MNPTLALQRNSVFGFAALLVAAIPAFWPTYFFPPKPEPNWRIHLHGVVMFLWVALLIAQAALIRYDVRPVHRALGRVSFLLVPLIVASTLLTANSRLKQQGLEPDLLYFFYLQLSLLTLLAISFAMAIRHRRRIALHARYLVCAALAGLDPIFARIFFFYLGVDYPLAQVMTFTMIDGILVWLAYRDVLARSGIRVFPTMLGVFVATQIPTFFISTTSAWRAFAGWYAALPFP